MEKAFVERRVYKGGEVRRGYRITGIEIQKDAPGSVPVELIDAEDMLHYSSGCPLHRGTCFGHMARTASGNLLPPHSLSFRSGDIRTQYHLAAKIAFSDDTDAYIKQLKTVCYKKEGLLRSTMSTPVSGSCRLVSIPHEDEDISTVFVSKNLASKVRFCLPERLGDGTEGAFYDERTLQEGDSVILERPPSLTKFNNQPLTVRYWDKHCLGVHPEIYSSFHGDYDGDEGHDYAIGTREAMEEAREWVHPSDSNLRKASVYMKSRFPLVYEGTGMSGDLKSISYSTLSFEQIHKGCLDLPLGDWTRNKSKNLRSLHERLESPSGTRSFLQKSIKGVSDLMRQQIPQGIIGDMSRTARIASTCFVRGKGGGTFALSRNLVLGIDISTSACTGCPAMRCMMLLCSSAQQSSLDAHRVGSKESKGMDLISSMLKGRSDSGGLKPCITLLVLKSGTKRSVAKAVFKAKWAHAVEECTFCLAEDSSVNPSNSGMVIGSYSPVVLASVEECCRKEVCRVAMYVVFNYYDLCPEGDDIDDIVNMYSFRVEMSTLPISSREGLLSRNMQWIETLIACDYTKLGSLVGSKSVPLGPTSAALCSNFRELS